MNHILHTCSLYAWIQIGVTLHNKIKKAQECGMGWKAMSVYISHVSNYKAKYAPIHIMVFHAHSWHRKKPNKTKLNMYKVKEK